MIYILKQNYEYSYLDDLEEQTFLQISKYYKYDNSQEDFVSFVRDSKCQYANVWKGGTQVNTFLPYKIYIKCVMWDEVEIDRIIKKHRERQRKLEETTKS